MGVMKKPAIKTLEFMEEDVGHNQNSLISSPGVFMVSHVNASDLRTLEVGDTPRNLGEGKE